MADGESASSSLEALLADYAEARDDERHVWALQGAAIALGLTTLGFLGAMAYKVSSGDSVPHAALAGAPLSIIVILSFIHSFGAQSTVRSFYMRALERELRLVAGLEEHDLGGYPGVRPLSSTELVTVNVSLNTRMTVVSAFRRFMVLSTWFTILSAFGGLTFYFALNVSPPWQLTMALIYGVSATIILLDAFNTYFNGRQTFQDHVGVVAVRLLRGLQPQDSERPRSEGRTLTSYLLLPRPDDLVKIIYAPLGIAVAAVVLKDFILTWGHFREIAVFVVGLEYLIYQARYQWNDIRGVAEDAGAPLEAERGRLPGGVKNINASLAVMALRIYLVVWIVSLQWGAEPRVSRSDWCLIVGVAAIFVLGLIYETIRSGNRGNLMLSRSRAWLLYLIVGAGYPTRFTLGWIAAGGWMDSIAYWLLCFAFWGLGICVVTLTWALEGASYLVAPVLGSPGRWLVKEKIRNKPHLANLLASLGLNPTDDTSAASGAPVDGATLKALQGREWAPSAPWVVGALLWTLGIGLALPKAFDLQAYWIPLFGAVLALGLSGTLLRGSMSQTAGGVLLVSAVSLSMWRSGLAQGVGVSLFLAFVASLNLIFFWFFYFQSYDSTRNGALRMLGGIAFLMQRGIDWFVGRPPRAKPNSMAPQESQRVGQA